MCEAAGTGFSDKADILNEAKASLEALL